MAGFLALIYFAVIVVFGVAQFAAGYAGIADGVGAGWAWAAVFLGITFRFILPITIGAFFGAMNVWGWHWVFALLFALPGLALMIPSVLVGILSLVKRSH